MGDRIGAGGPPHHSSAGAPLQPTFRGFIANTMDALVLFEACLSGVMSHVPRRPHDRERQSLIVSGNVFIYEEHSSGIKRWTDGVPWSPSRILGNFLLYRELDKPFQPGEKKRAMKKSKENGVSKSTPTPRSNSVGYGGMVQSASSLSGQFDPQGAAGRDTERALVGSLVDSYQFKADGLVKKTISVQYKGMHHHLVSYYNIDDVVNRKLRTPLETPELQRITPRSALISAGNFRAPVDDHEIVLDDRARMYMATGLPFGDYGAMSQVSRSMSVPSMNFQPGNAWPNPGHYGAPSAYSHMSHGLPSGSFTSQTSPSYGYDHVSQQHGLAAQGYATQMPMMNRRHSTVFGTNGNTNGSMGYSTVAPGLNRSLNDTQILPSSGSASSHLHPYASSIFDSPTAPTGSNQHNVYEAPSRHTSAYDNGASSQHTSSFNSQLNSSFDPTSAAQSTDYDTTLQSQHGTSSFASSGDNTPNGGLGIDDVDHAVTSPITEDGMAYAGIHFSNTHSQSQSVPC